MFDWLGGILSGLGDAIGIAFENATSDIVNSIWTALVQWLMNTCNNKIAYQVVRDVRDEAFKKLEILPKDQNVTEARSEQMLLDEWHHWTC